MRLSTVVLPSLEIGDEVYWKDPDEGVCSGYGTVTAIVGEKDLGAAVYRLRMNDGGEIEAFEHELR
tara:strand:+ start:1059 stop:1256 length:198 start_codon:yes stop_codon:yes gene_type:complete